MNDKRRDRRDVELDRFFALARQAPPDISGVERNFETRVMARIREGRNGSLGMPGRGGWPRSSWR